MNPSPQIAVLHIVVHAPVSALFVPSSHSSPVSTFPSPQAGLFPPLVLVPPPSPQPPTSVPENATRRNASVPIFEGLNGVRFMVARYVTNFAAGQYSCGQTMTEV
jgi:hypothetical protein